MAILTSTNLNLFYGQFQALKSVSLSVNANTIMALIGPSGCGKSTLLRVFNRMNDLIPGVKITGDVQAFGNSIFKMNMTELRKRVGMVFQRPNPFPLSIFNNVAYGPRVHSSVPSADLENTVEECLSAVGLWDDLKDKLKTNALGLSGEQQQRLCIARLLAVKPDILLMDEPCSALDPIATARIEDLMKDLKKNYTIIIVTHNMQQAARVSDDCGFMLMGDLVELGKTPQIFTAPNEKQTEDYISGRFG